MNESERRCVERFVRETLGCHCPDEVFRSVTLQAGSVPGGGPGFRRLVVGERLLIYVLTLRPGTTSADAVRTLAAMGRAERDARGYNRFRLVLAAGPGKRTAGAIIDGFAEVVAGDGRAHLHIVPGLDVPEAILAA